MTYIRWIQDLGSVVREVMGEIVKRVLVRYVSRLCGTKGVLCDKTNIVAGKKVL